MIKTDIKSDPSFNAAVSINPEKSTDTVEKYMGIIVLLFWLYSRLSC